MHLLSVLLHEYGLVLGINHRNDTHSMMSEELQPGVRRTVSDDVLTAIWNHIQESQAFDPTMPFDPSLPLGLSFFFGFARRKVEADKQRGNGILLPPLSLDPNASVLTNTRHWS